MVFKAESELDRLRALPTQVQTPEKSHDLEEAKKKGAKAAAGLKAVVDVLKVTLLEGE